MIINRTGSVTILRPAEGYRLYHLINKTFHEIVCLGIGDDMANYKEVPLEETVYFETHEEKIEQLQTDQDLQNENIDVMMEAIIELFEIAIAAEQPEAVTFSATRSQEASKVYQGITALYEILFSKGKRDSRQIPEIIKSQMFR